MISACTPPRLGSPLWYVKMSEPCPGPHTNTQANTHKNHCPTEPVCQSRYQLISVSSNGKTDLLSVDAAQLLIYWVLALLNIQTMEKREEGLKWKSGGKTGGGSRVWKMEKCNTQHHEFKNKKYLHRVSIGWKLHHHRGNRKHDFTVKLLVWFTVTSATCHRKERPISSWDSECVWVLSMCSTLNMVNIKANKRRIAQQTAHEQR